MNWLGLSHKFGGWGKDSCLGSNQDVHWVAPTTRDGRIMNIVQLYNTSHDLLLHKKHSDEVISQRSSRKIDCPSCGQGGGMILYNQTMYYNCFQSGDLCKNDMGNGTLMRRSLLSATPNNNFSYPSSPWQDMNMAADEEGLWVIYSTVKDAGNFVLSILNPTTLTVEQTWRTSQYKPAATNTFMVSGVLYATRPLSSSKEEIFYMYDTKTGEDEKISIVFDKMMPNIQSLNYNPNNRKLYMYNDGYLVTYDIEFKPKQYSKA